MGSHGASQEVPAHPLHSPLPREPHSSLLPPHGLPVCLRLHPALQVSCGQPCGGGTVCGPAVDAADSRRLGHHRRPALLPHHTALCLPEQPRWLRRVWIHQIHWPADSILLPPPSGRSGVHCSGCGIAPQVHISPHMCFYCRP